ncbi:hypothetical protein M0Q50_05335 [bacterium]|jgi:hypothetical protein|nr:hypothetical protein [bacterium]
MKTLRYEGTIFEIGDTITYKKKLKIFGFYKSNSMKIIGFTHNNIILTSDKCSGVHPSNVIKVTRKIKLDSLW